MPATESQAHEQVRIDRHYPVSIEKVWQAWTAPQALSRWFGASSEGSTTTAEVDLRAGGRYRITTTLADGKTNDVSGEYQVVEVRQRLVFTWAWRSTPDRISRVSIHFVAREDGSTDLHFVHDRFFDDQARQNHERGWQTLFVHLDACIHHPPESH